jgi:hypothetical protein
LEKDSTYLTGCAKDGSLNSAWSEDAMMTIQTDRCSGVGNENALIDLVSNLRREVTEVEGLVGDSMSGLPGLGATMAAHAKGDVFSRLIVNLIIGDIKGIIVLLAGTTGIALGLDDLDVALLTKLTLARHGDKTLLR